LRLFSFGGYGLALAALALVVFGAYESYPHLFRFVFWGEKTAVTMERFYRPVYRLMGSWKVHLQNYSKYCK